MPKGASGDAATAPSRGPFDLLVFDPLEPLCFLGSLIFGFFRRRASPSRFVSTLEPLVDDRGARWQRDSVEVDDLPVDDQHDPGD
jgi:hypothetical protein